MIGFSILNEVIQKLLGTGLVKKVYHSVFIYVDKADKSERYPVYSFPNDDGFEYVGIDDSKFMSCYIREIGDFVTDKVENKSSESKLIYGKQLYRIVFFNDFEERNHDDLLASFVKTTFTQYVVLNKIITNTDRLLTDETVLKDFNFGATTFYKAIDFYLTLILQDDTCENVISCNNQANPICLKIVNHAS